MDGHVRESGGRPERSAAIGASKQAVSALLRYYRGTGTDAAGRTREQVLQFTDDELESVHDYIQWLFPLPEPSQHNPRAPVLSPADIRAFQNDPNLRERLGTAFQMMRRFFNRLSWLSPDDHNYLRMTRMLRCMTLLGLTDEAAAFLAWLETIYVAHPEGIHQVTLRYWRNAVR